MRDQLGTFFMLMDSDGNTVAVVDRESTQPIEVKIENLTKDPRFIKLFGAALAAPALVEFLNQHGLDLVVSINGDERVVSWGKKDGRDDEKLRFLMDKVIMSELLLWTS